MYKNKLLEKHKELAKKNLVTPDYILDKSLLFVDEDTTREIPFPFNPDRGQNYTREEIQAHYSKPPMEVPLYRSYYNALKKAYIEIDFKPWSSLEGEKSEMITDGLRASFILDWIIFFGEEFTNLKELIELTGHKDVKELHPYIERLERLNKLVQSKSITKGKVFFDKSEFIYDEGESLKAYKKIKQILRGAKKEVYIIDPWIDVSFFELYIDNIPTHLRTNLLTRNPKSELKQVIRLYLDNKNRKSEIKTHKKIHDRIIFIDNEYCWIIGSSIKDAARTKPTYLFKMQDVTSMKSIYDKKWDEGTPF